MKIFVFVIFFGMISMVNAKDERDHSEIINIHETDIEMNKAIAQAQNTLTNFLKRYNNPKVGDSEFSLKIMIEDENGAEHFWVDDIEITKNGFEGTIANKARTVKLVSFGQRVVFDKSYITDWSYYHKGVRQGSYTLRVLLNRMPENQAEYYRKEVGW